MKIFFAFLLLTSLIASSPVRGQDTGHEHHAPADTTKDTHEPAAEHEGHDRMTEHAHGMYAAAPSAVLPVVPMERDGSGTSWIPDTSPMHAAHFRRGGWDLMLHGTAYVRYNAQDIFGSGNRGDQQLDSPNWIMGMARRDVSSRGQLSFRSMLSLDPLTVGGSGYPLLFQTGETFEGSPLVDRQHPHDLFVELAGAYGHRLADNAGLFVYLGMPGEPALGPPAFMHRSSAQHNPDAPLGHHWQDATHIVFGVATLGFSVGPVKVDGSIFTGREPDEERFGFDRPRFDSYSARVSLNPTERLALQVSRGFLTEPEHHEPGVDKWRTTASALYTQPVGRQGTWSSALVWGYNEAESDHGTGAHAHGNQHSLLADTDLEIGSQAFYGRAEWVQKTPEEIDVAVAKETLNVAALTLGTARDLWSTRGLQFSVGLQSTIYRVPDEIQQVYGENPISGQVYLRLAPTLMSHHRM